MASAQHHHHQRWCAAPHVGVSLQCVVLDLDLVGSISESVSRHHRTTQ
jgi:hypothetical protein